MISVCMATYNGERFLNEQLASILPQLASTDELIISDDGSTDETLTLLENYAQKDHRIKLINGPGKGVIANFENAIQQSQGEFIFLADQDDIWLPEKVSVIKEYFENHPEINLVVADLVIVDTELKPIEPSYFAYRKVRKGFVKNIIRSGYIGAGMAFRSTLKEKVLPFPPTIPMHDMWIALISEWENKSAFIDEPLTLYRRHEDNVSEIATDSSFLQQLSWRTSLVSALIKRGIKRK
ncbi:glycosyltransferase family 2 protein [Enterococcus sp. LJL99]